MKKIVFTTLILLVISCEKDSKFSQEIIGRWIYLGSDCHTEPWAPDIESQIIFEFKENGVLNISNITGETKVHHFIINNSTITLIIGDSEVEYKFWINQDILRLRYGVGEIDTCNYYFERIKIIPILNNRTCYNKMLNCIGTQFS